MTHEERIAAILADDRPEDLLAVEQVEPEPELADEPRPVVTVGAVSGRMVEVDAFSLKLAMVLSKVEGPDLTSCEFGRVLDTVKNNGHADLLRALLAVRADGLPMYRLRRDGRPWRRNPLAITQES